MWKRTLLLTLTLALAFVLVPQAAVEAQAQVALAAITIASPTEGQVVDPSAVLVTGTGTALPENNVVIQALDLQGDILGQTVATVNAELGGTGPWSANLPVSVAPGTQGQIYAFSSDAATGQAVAEALVNVTFGAAAVAPEQPIAPTPEQPVQPEQPIAPIPSVLTIDIPLPGEVTSFVEVVVNGRGSGLPENNVVVQALDGSGSVLADAVTTVDTAEQGGAGAWTVTLQLGVEPGTPGVIYAFSPSPADGSNVAEATVNVTYGQAGPVLPTPTPDAPPTATPAPTATPDTPIPGPAALTINIPQVNETISAQQVVVVGVGSSLPENNVVVQALDSNGTILAEEATTVDAGLGGSGEWRVTLDYAVDGGTTGHIYAFSPSPADSSTLAEDTVPVVYGQTEAESEITIIAPVSGAVINTDSGFQVSGSGFNLYEGNVVVEAYDANGRRLIQRPTTVDGNGNWNVSLYTGPINGQGGIAAFAPSPVDGSHMAEDRVDVTFASTPTQPVPPSVAIDRPTNGSRVNATSGFTVSGRAQGVFENNVVVQARDAYGTLLTQVVTTADLNGNWSTAIRFLVPSGTIGSVYAFSTSPADGRVVTDDLVRVTFTSACRVRTDWPIYVVQPGDTLFSIAQRTGSTVGELAFGNCLSNPNVIETGQKLHVPRLPDSGGDVAIEPEIVIDSPALDSELALDAPVIVEGHAQGTLPGNVFVRLLDNEGGVLDNVRGELVTEEDEDGVWTWTAELDAGDVEQGVRGHIFAYALTVVDGAIEVSSLLPVIYGEASDGPFVSIDAPLPYGLTGVGGESVTVSGRGQGLFEGNVIVRAVDNAGNVLVENYGTVSVEEIGDLGDWSVELAVDYIGRGQITASSTSPEDGSVIASAARDVYFGDPAAQDSFAVITHPLSNRVYTYADRLVTVAGYSDGVFDDQVFVTIIDEFGNIIFVIPVEVDPKSGFWATSLDVEIPVDQDRRYSINVVAAGPHDGAVFAGDRISVETRAPEAAVTGAVVYLERIALPDDAVVTVRVSDVSLADAPAKVIGEQVITHPGQPPIPYVVEYDPDVIDARFTYAVSARITDAEDKLLFISTTMIPVITNGAPTSDVEVLVESQQ